MSGQTTRGHKLFVEHVVRKLQPDLVVFLIGINDLWHFMREDFRPERELDTSWRIKLLGASRLLQLLYVWKQVLFDRVSVEVPDSINGQDVPRLAEKETLPKDLRELVPHLDQYRGNIRRLIAQTRSLNVKPVFLTQPLLCDNTPYWRERDGVPFWMRGARRHISAATQWQLLDLYNRDLIRTCREENVPCFDLASAIPHRPDYFYDLMHFNEPGADLVAREVARFLLREVLTPHEVQAHRR